MSHTSPHRLALAAITLSALSALAALPAAAQPVNEIAKLLPADGAADDRFGISVAVSGTTAVVGAFFDSDNGSRSGSAYLFDTTTGLQLFKLLPSDGAAFDNFGWSIAISGTTALVGALVDGDNGFSSGSAYLFDTTTGQQLFKLLATDGAAVDEFGHSVAISGTTAVVGARFDDDNGNNSGSAYVFDTTTGQQLFKLLPTDGAADDWFGWSVAVSGTTAVVGAFLDDDNGNNSGSAYLFDTTTGQQIAKLLPTDGADGDSFGYSVAISGTTVVVGATGDNDNGDGSGSAYIFDTTTGQQLFKLLATDGARRDTFGISVAISGTTAVVGALRDDDSGSAYLFDTTTGQQVSKLLPSDGAVNDEFGWFVAISDTTAVVGARFDDDNGDASGSAYLFDTFPDIDGDALPDDWEINGIPFVGLDGSARRYIIPGANPLRRDLYIEVDAAQIEMPASAKDLVVAAFARAPGTNPDGTEGITLHILIDEQGIDTPDSVVVGEAFPSNFDTLRNGHFGTPDERNDPDAPSLLAAKARVFRWCFAYSGIQFSADPGTVKYFGRGLIPGPSFLIDLDNDLYDVVLHPVTGPRDIASTFMHEYGHTLGLRHGGTDNIHGKPNYPSIMNYALAHTYPWNRSFRQLDFSREELLPLNESALDESRGINSSKYRRYRMPFGVGTNQNRRFAFVRLTGRATDFNGNGVRQGIVQQDLNFMPAIDFAGVGFPSPGDPLPGHNDWANIQYLPPTGRGGEESSGCMNATVYEFMSTQVPPPCEPDFNDDGLVNFFDLQDFLLAYNAGDLVADLAEPFDTLNFFDVVAFLTAFSAGCP